MHLKNLIKIQITFKGDETVNKFENEARNFVVRYTLIEASFIQRKNAALYDVVT